VTGLVRVPQQKAGTKLAEGATWGTTTMVLQVESASERGVYAASSRIGPAAWAFFNPVEIER
jgi:hypothetical protein